MVRSVGREKRDGSKTGKEQNERARILKLVALGQNEGKSSVRLRTTLLPRHRATPSMEIWDPSKDTRCKLFLYLNTYLCAVSATAWMEFAKADSFVLFINDRSIIFYIFRFIGEYFYFSMAERSEFEEKCKEMIGDYTRWKYFFDLKFLTSKSVL